MTRAVGGGQWSGVESAEGKAGGLYHGARVRQKNEPSKYECCDSVRRDTGRLQHDVYCRKNLYPGILGSE